MLKTLSVVYKPVISRTESLEILKGFCIKSYPTFFYWFVNKLKESERLDGTCKELNIKRDPWERYDILDSEYYYPILLSQRDLEETEQILLLHFVLRAIETGWFKRHYQFLRSRTRNADQPLPRLLQGRQ